MCLLGFLSRRAGKSVQRNPSPLIGTSISTMADESHCLESLQELHADLVALSESRLSNLDRLALQLEEHVHVFKALLDKKPRSEQSRKIVQPGEAHSQTGMA